MQNSKHPASADQFDQIVIGRILAEDFGQPQIKDAAFYKNRAVNQIKNAVQAIFNATNQHDFVTAIAQANAFIDAATDYEFIDLSEKAKWLDDIAAAMRAQQIEESA